MSLGSLSRKGRAELYKSFKIGSKKYTIKYRKQNPLDGNLGMCYTPTGEIIIQSKWNNMEIPDDSMEQTLFHEIVHAIMNEIGVDDHDEAFVQSFAVMMHQVFRTLK